MWETHFNLTRVWEPDNKKQRNLQIAINTNYTKSQIMLDTIYIRMWLFCTCVQVVITSSLNPKIK